MNGKQLKTLRERQGWTQRDLVGFLNPALDRKYSAGRVSTWENEKEPIPEHVEIFLSELFAGGEPDEVEQPAPDARSSDDTPPEANTITPERQQLLSKGSPYQEACEQLWEIIGTGIGIWGVAFGSEALVRDAAIIDMEKAKLGLAYAHLAETNKTFRNMLVSMTTGGAWLEVAMVTGGVASKMWRNHQELKPVDGTAVRVPEEPGGPQVADYPQAA